MLRRIERNQRSVVPDAVCMWLRTDCQFMYTNVKCNCHGLCHGVESPLMLLLLLLLMLVLLLMVVLYRLIRSVLGGKNCVGHIRDDGVLISRINYSSMRQIKIFPSIFSFGARGALFFPLRFSSTLLTLLIPSHHASWFFPLFYSINFFFHLTRWIVYFIPACKMLIFSWTRCFSSIFHIIFYGDKNAVVRDSSTHTHRSKMCVTEYQRGGKSEQNRYKWQKKGQNCVRY